MWEQGRGSHHGTGYFSDPHETGGGLAESDNSKHGEQTDSRKTQFEESIKEVLSDWIWGMI